MSAPVSRPAARSRAPWRLAPALLALGVALALLGPAAAVAPPHGDEAQYVWSAGYFGRRVLHLDFSPAGSDPLDDPGWAPTSYWALTQPMGTRLLYGIPIALAGAEVPERPFAAPPEGGRPIESAIPPPTLALARAIAVAVAACGFAVIAARWGWSGAAATAILLVPHVRLDLARAWAEAPLLLGFALAAAAWRTRWFPIVCGVAATLKLTALVLWPIVFFGHPIGRSRFARSLGLGVSSLVWAALTPPSWRFGGPLFLGGMLVNRFHEQGHLSNVYGGPMGQFFPTRYALPLELALAAAAVVLLRWMSRRVAGVPSLRQLAARVARAAAPGTQPYPAGS